MKSVIISLLEKHSWFHSQKLVKNVNILFWWTYYFDWLICYSDLEVACIDTTILLGDSFPGTTSLGVDLHEVCGLEHYSTYKYLCNTFGTIQMSEALIKKNCNVTSKFWHVIKTHSWYINKVWQKFSIYGYSQTT